MEELEEQGLIRTGKLDTAEIADIQSRIAAVRNDVLQQASIHMWSDEFIQNELRKRLAEQGLLSYLYQQITK